MSLSPQIQQMADKISQQVGLPPGLLTALVIKESGGNPNARSPVGALGLTQLMPHTAAGLGVSDPLNPYQNLLGGARYLKDQIGKFGSVPLALAAYNAGPTAVAKYGGVPPYAETQAYVRDIMAAMGQNGGAAQVGSGGVRLPSLASASSAPPATYQMPGISLQQAMDPDSMVQNFTQEMLREGQQLPSMHPDTPASPAAAAQGLSPMAAAITNVSKHYLGVPYKWGGDNPKTGLDCSAFTQQVYQQLGVHLPRVTTDQFKVGTPVALNRLQPGDLIFTEPGRGPAGGPGHVGLYLGNGHVQQSPHTGAVNDIIPLKDYLGGGFVGARRYLGAPKGGKR